MNFNDDNDYTSVFNLSADSKFNSFGNVSLENYLYLNQSEEDVTPSHDMFFTAARLKHID